MSCDVIRKSRNGKCFLNFLASKPNLYFYSLVLSVIILYIQNTFPNCIDDSLLMTECCYCVCMYFFSAVFTWTNLLVVVVELDGSESEALDLVALVTSAVLEEHHLVVGVVVVVDPGVVPINSRGEKQRMHLRDGFLADQLDPIYVAYNM